MKNDRAIAKKNANPGLNRFIEWDTPSIILKEYALSVNLPIIKNKIKKRYGERDLKNFSSLIFSGFLCLKVTLFFGIKNPFLVVNKIIINPTIGPIKEGNSCPKNVVKK